MASKLPRSFYGGGWSIAIFKDGNPILTVEGVKTAKEAEKFASVFQKFLSSQAKKERPEVPLEFMRKHNDG